MKTNKFCKKLLMIATMLALLLTACAPKNEIQSDAGQALVEQGEAYMTCIQEGDLECARALMSPTSQQLLAEAENIAEVVVNLDTLIKTYGPKIAEWTFERVHFSTRDGITIGSLEGQVEYLDGKRGKLSLEFEQDGETWKVRSSSMEE